MSSRPIRVAIVDDQALVREGFTLILESQEDINVAVQAANGQAFLQQLANGHRVDVALMDIRMPVLDGLSATRQLMSMRHSPAVIVITTFERDEYVLDAIAAGARGYLLKRSTGHELIDAVRRVASGEAILSPQVTGAVLDRVKSNGWRYTRVELASLNLSRRERDVLALIGDGLNNTEIAQQLFLSESTVKTHVGNVLVKTGSRDRVQAAILAIRTGLTGHEPPS